MPLGYSEEFWGTMGYTEYDPQRQVMRKFFPHTVPVTAGNEPLDKPISTGDPVVTDLPWEDLRSIHDGISLKQVTTESGRYYADGDARYPSITTVLNYMDDRSKLDEWKKRVGEEEAERVRERASYIGDTVHGLASSFCATGDWDELAHNELESRAINAHAGRITHAIEVYMDELHATEVPLVSRTLGCAGTVDLVCRWRLSGEEKGRLSVVDFKTKGKPMHPAALERYYLQCAFYAYAWKEMHGHTPSRLVVVESVEGSDREVIHSSPLFPDRIRPIADPSLDGGGFHGALARAKRECKSW